MQNTNKELGIDNPWFSTIKRDLDIAIRSAVLAAGDGRKTKVSVTMNFDEDTVYDDMPPLEENEKLISPIDYKIKVTAQDDVFNRDDSTVGLMVTTAESGRMVARKVGAQMNMFDDYKDSEA